MAILQAPAEKSFPTVPQGVYEASVIGVKPEDHTVEPDPWGNVGHWSLQFRWELWGPEDAYGAPITLLHTIKLELGTYLAKKGARVGHMPWLTEYTRAFGLPDIQPKQAVDTDMFLGKRARLHVLLDRNGDGKERNKINGISASKGDPSPAVPILDEDPRDLPF